MASPSKIKKVRRKKREHNKGKKRKTKVRREGSTKSKEALFGDN